MDSLNNNSDRKPDGAANCERGDSVSILEIIGIVRRYFWILFFILVLLTVSSIFLAMSLPKIYRTKTTLHPPTSRDVQIANLLESYEITADDLFEEAYNSIKNEELRFRLLKDLINEGDLKSNEENKFSHDAKSIFRKITVRRVNDRKANDQYMTVFIEGKSPQSIAKILNGYIEKIDNYTTSLTKETIKTIIDRDILILEQRIKSFRNLAEKKRFDEIAHLEESALIAEKIGLNEPPEGLMLQYDQNIIKWNVSNSNKESINSLETGSKTDYLQGANALRAQIAVLKQRKNDDSFVSELRSFEEELFYLNEFDVSKLDFKTIQVSSKAQVLVDPVRPKVFLIVIAGIFAGLLINCLMILVICSFRKNIKLMS